ncbi:MAG: sigma 54-interacting transcriptional regulator [Desulfobacterales bacterium]|nr:sigma 54-interacting transcriptional regulator [Desulfobacterales bacterium]
MSAQHEELCSKEQALIEAVFESVPGLLFLYTEDGRLIRWNKRHEEMTGYTSDELLNFRVEDWFNEEDRAILAKEWPKVFSEGQNQTELNVILKDGRKVPFFFSAVRLVLDGKPHLVGIGIDITDKKQQDEALRKTEDILKRAEEIARLGSWQLDIVKNELFWSDEVYRIFWIPIGHPLTYDAFLAIVHPEDRSFVDDAWKAALQKAPYDIEHRIIVDGKVRWVHEKARIEFNAAGEPVRGTGIVHDITDKKKAEQEKEKALNEIKQLKDLLEVENIYLKKEIRALYAPDDIIGQSDAIQYVLFRVQQVAETDTTVLLLGETGTGKGRIARLIHERSQRSRKPLVMVNCSGLPGNLIESELFGREKGAFTGAESKQIGRFELADGGTIFLDEIAEMPVELQAKLLRVIENGEFERLGSPYTVKVDVRIIASTNRNLTEEIGKGRFRNDLFYRLNIFPITLPPLRQRKEDIPQLAHYFLEKYNKQIGRKITKIPEETMRSLQVHAWPGNVRELMGVIERAVITNFDTPLNLPETIALGHEAITPELQTKKRLADVEKNHICRILRESDWRIEGPKGAAQQLGMHPSTLRNRMKKLGIKRLHLSK